MILCGFWGWSCERFGGILWQYLSAWRIFALADIRHNTINIARAVTDYGTKNN